LDRCKSLGADIVIDYHKEKNISDALIKQGINSVDIIYETVNSVSESVSVKYGCMVLIDAGDSLPRFLKNLITRKIWGENINFFDGLSVDIEKTRGKIIQLIESNAVQKLKIELFQGLDKTREALTYLHKSVTASKVVVQIY
jgi:NADPH-dependent curcumin reductase CurA